MYVVGETERGEEHGDFGWVGTVLAPYFDGLEA
jgi:hypothetical protein